MFMPSKEERIENLRRCNAEAHQLIVESLKDALYRLLETKDIRDIRVVDLVKAAGVSRGVFYKSYYLVTDILADDIQMIADDVRRAMGEDIGMNWKIMLETVYRHREKIPLLLKAGMGFEILNQINRSIDAVDNRFKLRIMAWNGIIFNGVLYWVEQGFAGDLDELAAQLTELTTPLYNADVAASFRDGFTV